MKKNILKKVSFKIGLLAIFIIGAIMINSIVPDSKDLTLRIGFGATRPIEKYEPTNIHFANEYLLLENVYSSLVELNPKTGAVQPGIAESYSWNGDALELQIRKNLFTKSGKQIRASDVLFSLKRLLVLSANTHGNFKDLVCPDFKLTDVEQNCPGLSVIDDKIILKAGKRKSFLLPMLTTVDFAVIPQSSVDPKTLAINDYSETSGLYFVSKSDEKGNIELLPNKSHYHYSAEVPQKVIFVPSDRNKTNSALQNFVDEKVDHLMTWSGTLPEEVIKGAEAIDDANLHLTMKIQTQVLVFTERGRRELSEDYRRFIGTQVKSAFQKINEGRKGYEKTAEFFPAFSDGGLSKDQQKEVNKIFESRSKDEGKSFKLAFLKMGDLEPWLGPVSEALPKATIYLEKNIPAMHKYEKLEDEPHAVIMATDSGFKEDISLISYSLNAGIFGMNKKERADWVAQYMEQTDSDLRLLELRKLHFQALASADLVPLFVSPYAALVRKPWKMELSEIYANNQLWLLKRD